MDSEGLLAAARHDDDDRLRVTAHLASVERDRLVACGRYWEADFFHELSVACSTALAEHKALAEAADAAVNPFQIVFAGQRPEL